MSNDWVVGTKDDLAAELERVTQRDSTVLAWTARHDDEQIIDASRVAPRLHVSRPDPGYVWKFIIEVAGTGSEVYIEVEIDIDWRPLGRSWTFAGRSWSSLGGILAGASGQNAAWREPKGSKMDFQRRLGLQTRFLQKVPLGLATSIKHWRSSRIENLYFHDTNPLHWLARIHLRAPKLIVTDEFGQEFWSLPMEISAIVT